MQIFKTFTLLSASFYVFIAFMLGSALLFQQESGIASTPVSLAQQDSVSEHNLDFEFIYLAKNDTK